MKAINYLRDKDDAEAEIDAAAARGEAAAEARTAVASDVKTRATATHPQ